jgi:triphosphoribosyl-dephospho-CoA synthetase
LFRVIPEIDIWRAANLMLKRYGGKALKESSARADELESRGDYDGAATWRRITVAVEQLEKKAYSAKTLTGRGRVFRLC